MQKRRIEVPDSLPSNPLGRSKKGILTKKGFMVREQVMVCGIQVERWGFYHSHGSRWGKPEHFQISELLLKYEPVKGYLQGELIFTGMDESEEDV